MVGRDSRAVNLAMERLHWRRRYGVYVVAMTRSRGEAVGPGLRLRGGDRLMLEGESGQIDRLVGEERMLPLSPVEARACRLGKAPIAPATMAAVVLMTDCIDADESMAAIDERLVLLIVSMLILGRSVENSGALDMVIGWLRPC